QRRLDRVVGRPAIGTILSARVGSMGSRSARTNKVSRSGEGSRSPRPTDTLEEFERLLHLGLGRAVLFLRGHDARPYREAIVHACVQHLGYDAQLESSRATYLFDVIEATHDEASFVEPVTTALLTAAEHWSMVQLFYLAALL